MSLLSTAPVIFGFGFLSAALTSIAIDWAASRGRQTRVKP